MGPPKREPRPPQPGLSGPVDTEPQVESIVLDRADHRRRPIQRQAVIAQVRAAYGPSADLQLSPPGPDVCPPGCPWCPPRPRPGEPDYLAGLAIGAA
jgi:hypothetical protein